MTSPAQPPSPLPHRSSKSGGDGMATGEFLAWLRASANESLKAVHYGERMMARVALDAADALETAERELRRVQKRILREPHHKDHACAQCVPDGEIVQPGFVCVYHVALAALGGESCP